MTGKIKPKLNADKLERLTGGQLFTDPANGDFTINSTLGLSANLGVDPDTIAYLSTKATGFGANVGASSFVVDHLKLTQTILDNIPGINDGITGNEKVFTDYGIMSPDHTTIHYDVYDGVWKRQTGSASTQDFNLNPAYVNWYREVAKNYKNSSGNEYTRIRWGDSEIRQNQKFESDWLTVCQIKSKSDHTLINGADYKFELGGDILIDFEGYTPSDGDYFDLMSAKEINGRNSIGSILFEGYTPTKYSLEVADVSGKQVLRLTIGDALGIDSEESIGLRVFPNPSKGSFLLETDKKIQSIEMFNMQGESVTGKLNIIRIGKGYQISTENIAPGVYIMKADNIPSRIVIK